MLYELRVITLDRDFVKINLADSDNQHKDLSKITKRRENDALRKNPSNLSKLRY